MKKRVLVLICAALLITVFACGCAKKQAEDSTVPSTATAEVTEQAEDLQQVGSAPLTPEEVSTEKESAQTTESASESSTAQGETDTSSQEQEDYTEPQVDFSDLE